MTHIFREFGPFMWLLVAHGALIGAAIVLFFTYLLDSDYFGAAICIVVIATNGFFIWSAFQHPPNMTITHIECEKCHPDDGRVQMHVGPKMGGDQAIAARPKLT
jgi:hypothetical protein